MAIVWFLLWQLAGYAAARYRFNSKRFTVRLWLGSVIGMLMSMWMPVFFAFAFGFTVKAHAFAMAAGVLAGAAMWHLSRKKSLSWDTTGEDESFAGFLIPVLTQCLIILENHTLSESKSGRLFTGQCTYGDMCMHLGFITSIAEQGMFPPFYSILPTAKLCYPFLCDSVSASLYLLGMPLRWAYILPAALALAQVIAGFLFLAAEMVREKNAAVLAAVLFFFNGGLGIIYFLNGEHSFAELFTGFYVTPTNLTESGMRWVNVIADMLIPQRATLFGWAGLFTALYLLYRAVFEDDKACAVPAGIIGGALPMVHTHSFFALGLTAMCWMVYSLIRDGWHKKWLFLWMKFGFTAVALAVPQICIWTLNSVEGNEQFLRIGIDWVNGLEENWLWFWFKNVGPLFVLTPVAFCLGDKEQAGKYSPIFFIFFLCELVLFQPNPYDNNKLLYIGYLFACVLCADTLMKWLKGKKWRNAVLAVVLIVCCNAAVLTLAREVYSGTYTAGYQLFSDCEQEAAEYIKSSTQSDAVFLTADNHDNTVSVLTGRNIVCGTPSYLYYHGLDYTQALEDEKIMLRGGEAFESLKDKYNVSYVYIGPNERSGDVDEAYFSASYEQVFKSGNVAIYKVK